MRDNRENISIYQGGIVVEVFRFGECLGPASIHISRSLRKIRFKDETRAET